MFTRRIARSSITSQPLRAFTTTSTSLSRTPALSNITPQGVASFDAKQKEFRERIAEQHRKKEAASESKLSSQAQNSASADHTLNGVEHTNENGEKKGKLSSLIYGTPEGREMEKEIEQSFSQVLARGKYVHSIVFHEVKPDKVDDIASQPGFQEFDKKLKSLITKKNVSLMQEFSFWPTTAPRDLGGLFELRSYTLHPGNLLEWETHWRRGLKARREVMEGVGAWFVQIGELNTVHHLWQFADLEERKKRREQSWEIEGWGDTVHKTVPLIQNMKSRVLIPMPWSPVA
ncbi:putative nipsnap family protein [Botrytis cinerea BcDW1]|uniref:Putative nipsnap family protein n=1 Tax=Botryotinia fuckeliana (strain BcDW1) TaxID=1290391 RepID=M7TXY4_BOTF1|nr:putative nipsnap family protein [Botrytis cinerea BcDW1]